MTIRNVISSAILFILLILTSCKEGNNIGNESIKVYSDTTFKQEYHIGYQIAEDDKSNNVNSIAVDSLQNIWIATKCGVFLKKQQENQWKPIQNIEDMGPSFNIEVDKENNVWISTWNGLYKYAQNSLKKINKIKPPVYNLTSTPNGIYVFGYFGNWLISKKEITKLDINISKGVRDAVYDNSNGLWIATDVGLYHYNKDSTILFQDETELISCYLRGVSYSQNNNLWLAGLGGVTIRNENSIVKKLTPKDGIPNAEVNCVKKDRNNSMWVGTNYGIVRFEQDGSHSLRFSKRWLVDNEVRDIAFDNNGTAWIATKNGVSSIKNRELTLKQKEKFFYSKLLKKHVREPWIVHRVGLERYGDTASWKPMDDDNDGEYTAIYLSMESLRYATTGAPDAKEKASKAFSTLKFLQEITETNGFFARTVIPIEWNKMHDPNRKYTEKEYAAELIKDPRFKKVETRWSKSSDGKWLWKGDTSSDEMCGHFMGYYYFYEFAANENEKEILRKHVAKITDYLIDNNYNFIDIDGSHTRWGVWSPDKLNRDPDWAPERSLNSFELLSFLKFTYHITQNEKYQNEYLRLINEENFLVNISNLNKKNPAWKIYFDIPMAGYLFPLLVKLEENPKLKLFYETLMDEWFENQRSGKNPLNNLIYCYTRNKKEEIASSIDFLIDTPLDLVDWKIDHSKREDISIVRKPILEELQTSKFIPASERATVRWDKNPWAAIQGNPYSEREPVFWLFPYWMGKYLEIIKN